RGEKRRLEGVVLLRPGHESSRSTARLGRCVWDYGRSDPRCQRKIVEPDGALLSFFEVYEPCAENRWVLLLPASFSFGHGPSRSLPALEHGDVDEPGHGAEPDQHHEVRDHVYQRAARLECLD